jgi:D-alanyl-D-alanine carboxypeptidase (penicillin-binding protein 5/6)
MNKRILSFFIIICIFSITYSGFFAAADAVQSNLPPTITAQTAIVADADTGEIYYQKNMHQQMYPASITKILTGILAVEKTNPQDVITIPDDISKGMPSDSASIALQGGEMITVEEALYTMFLASANDSANALALQVGGTIPNFVTMMNERAKELGAVDSHFDNANGLPDSNNVTSAYDMALITQQAISMPELMKYFGAITYTLPPTNKRTNSEAFITLDKMMKNTVYKYPGMIAGKTGWETMSGNTLVSVASRNGRKLICVVMKSSGDYWVYSDSIALLNYCFTLPANNDCDDYLLKPLPITQIAAVQNAPAPTPIAAKVVKVKATPKYDYTYAAPLLLLAVSAVIFSAFIARYRKKNCAAQSSIRRRTSRTSK